MKKRKDEITEINSILDREYFHTNITVHEDETISWRIYYRNLPEQVYWSNKNKPILTSDKNTKADIYKLRNKFEREKEKEIMKNLPEEVKICSMIRRGILQIMKYSCIDTTIDSLAIIVILFVNCIFVRNFTLSIFLLFITLAKCFVTVHIQDKIDKEHRKVENEFRKNFVKEKIKQQGLFFADKLRD